MANTLTSLLPPSRSGKTFTIALSLLGLLALAQLLLLGGYLLRGGVSSHRSTINTPPSPHFADSSKPEIGTLVAPTPFIAAIPSPVPLTAAETPALVLVRPTPAPAPRLQNNPADLLEQARQLRSRGDMNSALARLREAEVAEPDSPQIIAEMALTYEAMQMPDRAFEQWQRIYNQGEAVGALYSLAESRLHRVPGAAAPPATDGTGASALAATDTSAFQGQGDTVLKLTDIHLETLQDPAAEQKIALNIVVKNRPRTVIDPTKVKILAYFYDLVDGKDIVKTNAQTEFAWLTPGRIDWADDKSEVLQTTYTRLKAAPEPAPPAATPAPPKRGAHRSKGNVPEATPAAPTPTPAPPPVRTYLGYCVQLYYDGQLQDVQADPVRLLQQFPAPLTLAAE